MKKFIALIISVIMIFSVMPLSAFAAEILSVIEIGDISEPVPGQTPDYVATYGSGYNFTTTFDNQNMKYGIAWVDITTGTAKSMTSTDVFQVGHKYRVAVVVKAQSGYLFSKTGNFTTSVAGRINGKNGNAYAITGYNAGEYVGITYEFAVCDYARISSCGVTGLDIPAAGEKIDFTAVPEDDSYTVSSVYWRDATANSSVSEGSVAVAGHKYEVEIWLRAKDNYRFKVDGEGYPSVSAKIGAYNATVIETTSEGVVVGITDSYIVPDDITTVTVSGIDAPVTGATAGTTATCGSGYQITEIVWVDTTGEYKDYIYGITEFEAEREYTVQITLTTIGNYRFVMDGPYNDVSGKINNNSAIVYGSNLSTEVTIGYEFPATEKAAPTIISTVYVNGIDAPEFGKAPDTEGTCGEGYEITEIVWVDTTGEYKDHVYDITEFEVGHEYTVQITLKVKDGYEFSSDGYYNDVTGEINMEPAIEYGTDSVTELSIGYEFPAVEAPEHTHEYTSVVTAPTCTEKGYTTYTCACGDTYKADETAATGHTEEIIPGKAATETETGLTEGKKCSVCGEILVAQEEIPVLAHKHDYVFTVTLPTCTEKGYTTYTCACGDTYKADEKDATGHVFGEWKVVKPAEIGVEGKEERKCKSCDKTEERTIPALENPDADVMLGDVNKDGKITAADARLALRVSAKLETLTDYIQKTADMNKDGKITAADARKILRVSAKLEEI